MRRTTMKLYVKFFILFLRYSQFIVVKFISQFILV